MRSCDSPEPEFGGKHCVGDGDEVITCNEFMCPGKRSRSEVRGQRSGVRGQGSGQGS